MTRPIVPASAAGGRLNAADRPGHALVSVFDPDVKAVAGIRIGEWLPTGGCLEIEDLVTRFYLRKGMSILAHFFSLSLR